MLQELVDQARREDEIRSARLCVRAGWFQIGVSADAVFSLPVYRL